MFYANTPDGGWLIYKYKNDFSKSAMTNGLAAQIDLLAERYGYEYLELSERVLQMMHKLDLDILKVANRQCFGFMKEQVKFLDSGEYGHTDYDTIKEKVYDNPKVMMEEYMPGIFWAYSTTSLLYTKYHLFRNKFLPRLEAQRERCAGLAGVDIGFGAGFYIWELLSHLPNAYCKGYDISLYAVEFASIVLKSADIPQENYKLCPGDVRETIISEAGSNDFGILAEVIEHIPNPRQAINNMNRLLKNGGLLYLTTVKDSNHMDHMTNFESSEEVEELIESSGFEILDKSINRIKDDLPDLGDISVGLAYVCRKAGN